MIAGLVSGPVVTEQAGPEDWTAALLPEEAASLGAVHPVRRREFAAGRACARRGLVRLDMLPQPVPIGTGRNPAWPAGVTGSITHCQDFCAAVVTRAEDFGIGIDAEPLAALSPAALAMVRAPGDEWLAGQWRGILAFSAKEAIYKAWYALTGQQLRFHDVRLRVDGRRDRFDADIRTSAVLPPATVTGRFALDDRRVYTVATAGR